MARPRSGTQQIAAGQALFRGTTHDWFVLPLKGGFSYLQLVGGDYQPVNADAQQMQAICNDLLMGAYIAIPWTGSIAGTTTSTRAGTAATQVATAGTDGRRNRGRVSNASTIREAATSGITGSNGTG